MTEAEWAACTEPALMLGFLRGEVVTLVDDLPTQAARDAVRAFLQEPVTRKLRLFACWCCRRIWAQLVDGRSRDAVEVLERFADQLATQEQLWAAHLGAVIARNSIRGDHIRRIAANAACAVSDFEFETAASESATVVNWVDDVPLPSDARTEQAQALLCIFGNPFRPVTADPSWLTSTVAALATGIYADHAFDRLPILADALQDAGCEDAAVLTHLRGPGPHARGCWVVDLVLGKV